MFPPPKKKSGWKGLKLEHSPKKHPQRHIRSPAADHRYNDSMVEVQRHKVIASLSRDGIYGGFLK